VEELLSLLTDIQHLTLIVSLRPISATHF
jgi:hypothetical protein